MYKYALALALRGALHHLRSSAMVVVVIALGLTACMTILTVFHTLASDPLDGHGAAVETILLKPQGSAPAASQALLKYATVQQIVSRAQDMPMMAMVVSPNRVQTDDKQGPSIDNASVVAATSNIASVFGITLARGHWWTARDDRAHEPVAVVSQKVAKRLFGTEAALGETILVGGTPVRIIGIRSPWAPTLQFYAQGATLYQRTMAQILMPLSVAADAQLQLTSLSRCEGSAFRTPWRDCGLAQVWAYGLDDIQQAKLLRLVHDFTDVAPTHKQFNATLVNIPGWLRIQHVLPDSMRAYVWIAVAFLALCLFNAAGVLGARFMSRSSEVGIRRALGASKRDVFAQHLFESGCLALIGGLLALPLTLGALAMLRAQAVRYSTIVHFSIDTFIGLCLFTVITGLLVGIYPAWRASARPPALQVKQN
jgi:putative ABC transport system permease protein